MTTLLTPAQYEEHLAAERARLEHNTRREVHLQRLFAPRPLEAWAQQRIQAYWRELHKESGNVRKTA